MTEQIVIAALSFLGVIVAVVVAHWLKNRRPSDKRIAREFYGCFDRHAFRQPFLHETDLEALADALDDTIAALSTGVKRTRKGDVFGARGPGKAYIKSAKLRKAFDEIVNSLSQAKDCYCQAKREGLFEPGVWQGKPLVSFDVGRLDEACRVAARIDDLRNQALVSANDVYKQMHMRPFPYIMQPSAHSLSLQEFYYHKWRKRR